MEVIIIEGSSGCIVDDLEEWIVETEVDGVSLRAVFESVAAEAEVVASEGLLNVNLPTLLGLERELGDPAETAGRLINTKQNTSLIGCRFFGH